MIKGLRDYLELIEKKFPSDILHIDAEVNPANFDVTAALKHLENAGDYPLTYFSRCLNVKGEVSAFPLVTNMYASRKRCALAMGLEEGQVNLPLSLEYGWSL